MGVDVTGNPKLSKLCGMAAPKKAVATALQLLWWCILAAQPEQRDGLALITQPPRECRRAGEAQLRGDRLL